MIRLELPWPPSVNDMYKPIGRRFVKTKKAKAYQDTVKSICIANGVSRMFEGAIKINVELYPPDRRRRDWDNSMKAVCDSIQAGGVYKDDSQIIEAFVRKNPPIDGGKVSIFVEEIGENSYG